MLDFKFLPSSKAQQLSDIQITENEFSFTFTEHADEKKLYKEISMRLIALEKSLDVNKKELEDIYNKTQGFQLAIEEKEEVLLRLDWLNRLYKAKEEIKSVETKEKAKQLHRLISPVQTCPMKKQLMSEINSLEQSLPEEKVIFEKPSNEQILMEKAIEEVGDIFINLGKAGRAFVISDVLKRFGDSASIKDIKDSTLKLEQHVKDLAEINNPTELLNHLEQLPLQSFSDLEVGKKEKVVERILKNSQWNGLSSLDRTIAQLDKVITKEERDQYERENFIILQNGEKASVSLDQEWF